MSNLAERLKRIKAGFLKQAPPEAVAVMEQATNDLRHSGIMSQIPVVGSKLPDFKLEDTDRNVVNSQALIDKTTLVISFYRGVW